MKISKVAILFAAVMLSAQSGRSGWEYLRVNTATGAFLPSGVAGVSYNGLPVGTDVPGYVTVNLHYSPTGAWKGGTLHLLAWNNAQMNGMTVFNKTYAYADIRGLNSITVPNTQVLVGSTYWYAWLDGDADGTFNSSKAVTQDPVGLRTLLYYPFNEPAAQAEHAPTTLASVGGYATVNIWLLDVKGNTYRCGTEVDTAALHIKHSIRNLSVAGAPTLIQGYTSSHDFLLEAFYSRTDSEMIDDDTPKTPWEGDRVSVGGFAADYIAGSFEYFKDTTTFDTIYWGRDSTPPYAHLPNPANAASGNAPVASHPTAAEVLTSNTIEFSFTGQWETYSAVQLEVLEDSNVGASRYAYSGYMENKHYDDGTTRHMGRTLTLTAGKTYYWRVRCVYGHPADGDFLPTAYSTWATFVYQP